MSLNKNEFKYDCKRIHSRSECAQQIKAAQDNNGQEQRIVVEDREGSCFIICYFILLPQDPRIVYSDNEYQHKLTI